MAVTAVLYLIENCIIPEHTDNLNSGIAWDKSNARIYNIYKSQKQQT